MFNHNVKHTEIGAVIQAERGWCFSPSLMLKFFDGARKADTLH